jgi:hypothetical protein
MAFWRSASMKGSGMGKSWACGFGDETSQPLIYMGRHTGIEPVTTGATI